MMLFTLQMAIVWILNISTHGFSYFIHRNWMMLIFFILYLLLDIWILTATFLPLIKISNNGISAYSLFWSRTIKWEEIKSANLLKMKTRGSRGGSVGSSSVFFDTTQQPEIKNNALTNKGLRVNTFIIVSKGSYQNPSSLSLGGRLVTHGKMTTKDEIAFMYDKEAWQSIQNRLND